MALQTEVLGGRRGGRGDGAYLVRVVGETAATSSIAVLDEEGNPLASPTAQRILTVLHEQLE